MLSAIRSRFAECGLELHPTKTRIVYCKVGNRRGEHEHVAFDFLGYTFQPRQAKTRNGKLFMSFLPAISAKAAKKIRAAIRKWRTASTRSNQCLEDLARLVDRHMDANVALLMAEDQPIGHTRRRPEPPRQLFNGDIACVVRTWATRGNAPPGTTPKAARER